MKKAKNNFLETNYIDNLHLPVSGFFRSDMHVHTTHSDGMSTAARILKKARKLGIAFAITDHNTINGVIEAYKLKEKGDIIIPGIELHSNEGPHFLFYFETLDELKEFYENEVKPHKLSDIIYRTSLTINDIENLAQRTRNATVSIAHPEALLWANIENVIKKKKIKTDIFRKVHAAEIMCGQQSRMINKRSMLFAERHKLSVTGGSDAHSVVEFGTILTVAKAKDIKEFLEAIRKKESFVAGKEAAIHKKAIPRINMVRKMVNKQINHFPSYVRNKIRRNKK